MKMIASTKVTKAQRNMEAARVYGNAANAIFKYAETTDVPSNSTATTEQQSSSSKPLVIAVSSDRGLCGGIHSAVSKSVKRYVAKTPSASAPIVVLGMKARNQIQREYRSNIQATFDQVTKNFPTWIEAATIGDHVLKIGTECNVTGTRVFYNKFKSVIAYDTTSVPVFTLDAIAASPKIDAYEVEPDVLQSLQEFTLANTLYWTISEGYASEMAAKRQAMDNATKNAGEMIQKLTLTYNRSRQASITNDLIDIITGAMAV